MAVSKRIRTDLALETTERFKEENTEIRGVEIQEDYDEEKDVRTTVVRIVTENGAKAMGRPCVKISLAGVSDALFLRGTQTVFNNAKPGRIVDDIKIDQTYPRDRSSQAFVEYRNRILNQLHFGGNS